MRILVISDIHANSTALEAVLKDARSFDQVWCLGDVVGYGPQPNECIERLKELEPVCLAGNHDVTTIGKAEISEFSKDAQEVILWTRQQLKRENFDWLRALPETPRVMENNITIVHASLRDPLWEYVTDISIAKGNLELSQTPICFNGHTHFPMIFRKRWDEWQILDEYPRTNSPIALTPDRMLINPGSVGQPRDEDPRAAYAILDTQTMTYTQYRVLYDVAYVQGLMKKARFSNRLIRRLRFGQ